MRIIAGQFRSRQLKGTPPAGLRPTSDKLRETLFNILGPRVVDSQFVDICAGMGGVGIEAISRGAQFVYFVDFSPGACAMIRGNLSSLGVASGFRVLESDVGKAIVQFLRDEVAVDIAFFDPPYAREDLYTMALQAFGTRPLLREDGILVVEHSRRIETPGATARCLSTGKTRDHCHLSGFLRSINIWSHRYCGPQRPPVRSCGHRDSHQFAEIAPVHH
jgi:16S rRNA (guanine(966)-N(2))-methyltransferase RsmD